MAYNLTVSIMDESYKATGKSGRYLACRKDWIVRIREKMPWLAEIPAHTIYGAMIDAEKDYKTVIKKRAKTQTANELPRCRRRTQRSFYILGNAVTQRGIYPQKLGPIISAEPLPEKPMDSRIIFEAGKFWLRVPEKVVNARAENQGRVCAIDPGIRTFATLYSPNGVGKIQKGGFSRVMRLALCLDDLIGRTTKEKNRQRKQKMQIAISRLRLRVRNLIDDLHFQSISWLFKNFDVVVFPSGNFLSATHKANRKIRAKSVRALLSFAFAKFRNRLEHKAQLLGKKVVQVCEAYTSKTHNITGELKHNLGGSKTTTSNGIKIDRDLNGALGIFLKALLAQPAEEPHCYQKVS